MKLLSITLCFIFLINFSYAHRKYFYLGNYRHYDKSPDVIKYVLTEDEFDKYIIMSGSDLFGVILCVTNGTQYLLRGNEKASFTISKSADQYAKAVIPAPYPPFNILLMDSFAMSSNTYQDLYSYMNDDSISSFPYYKDVLLFYPNELFMNPDKKFNWNEYICSYSLINN